MDTTWEKQTDNDSFQTTSLVFSFYFPFIFHNIHSHGKNPFADEWLLQGELKWQEKLKMVETVPCLVDMIVFSDRLDSIISEVFSTLTDSVILGWVTDLGRI